MTAGTVRLTRGQHGRIRQGHPWIYRNEIAGVVGAEDGSIVEILDHSGKYLGSGYYNSVSVIAARMLTREKEAIDAAFFARRLKLALDHRRSYGGQASSYRLVHSEGDFLPGLVVDKFGQVLVIQTLTLGMEQWKESICSILLELVSPLGMYERNDAPVRQLEGMAERAGFLGEPFDPLVTIDEHGMKLIVDVQRGQKTGHFLDQAANRVAVARYCRGARVLDCFSYTGGFAIQAARAGASAVTGIEQAEPALDLARANAMANGVAGTCSFEAGNVFDTLRLLERQKSKFDVVILDPPAFARSRSALPGAVRGYKEINLRAMKLLSKGGILASCSCSHHLGEEDFTQILVEAAADVGCQLRLLERRGQPPDHPVLSAVPESSYLKCLIVEVL